ncbi:Protein of unknown function [Lactobacillus delbrueckii subsp. lactis]|nr:Protein of unknown function [Lactobacillus delbrueckii subsp. lactis]
MKRYQTLV